jgi:hypothetical protein
VKNFTEILKKPIFLKTIMIIALEVIFFINIVKNMQIQDILKINHLEPFDFWRAIDRFIGTNIHDMPKSLCKHFRDIEIKIVMELAWNSTSPLVEVVKKLCQSEDLCNQLAHSTPAFVVYKFFFQRVLEISSQRILDLSKALYLEDETIEKIWTIMKTQLSMEPELMINH